MSVCAKELGKRLQEARKAKGLKQSYIAECLDLSDQHISRIENGVKPIYLHKFAEYCDLLGVSVVDILAPAEETEHPAYGTQFDAIVASCTPERVEEILRVCRIMAEME